MRERARVLCVIQHIRWNDTLREYEPVPCPLSTAPHPLVVEPGPFEGDEPVPVRLASTVVTLLTYVLAAYGFLSLAGTLLGLS